ncbi:MAG: hypothetical protein ACKVS5_02555, partial [Parvularculaceae bacterium]
HRRSPCRHTPRTPPVELATRDARAGRSLICAHQTGGLRRMLTTFWAVGNQYRRFPQLKDIDVINILKRFKMRPIGPINDE